MVSISAPRSARIDNLRAGLILLVVLGHLLEWVQFPGSRGVYLAIYAFHMPGFALLSGLCFKPDPGGRTLKNVVYPYFIFQTIYLVFEAWRNQGPLTIQYTTPVWLLWYLLALAGWSIIGMLLPPGKRSGLAAVACSVVLAVLVGFDKTVGYYASLSRMLVLLPFFLMGVWLKRYGGAAMQRLNDRGPVLRLGALAALIGCAAFILRFVQPRVQNNWFYHSMPYGDGYGPLIRLGQLALAAGMLACLLVLTPDRPLGHWTEIGRRTMPVFLIHGLAVRLLGHFGALGRLPLPALTAPLLAAALVLALSAGPVVKLTQPLWRWPFHRKRPATARA